MSGFIALWQKTGRTIPDLTAVTETMRHRGPDEQDAYIWVGSFSSLSVKIIDLSAGPPALLNEDGSLALF